MHRRFAGDESDSEVTDLNQCRSITVNHCVGGLSRTDGRDRFSVHCTTFE
jgi:hypothetical protein